MNTKTATTLILANLTSPDVRQTLGITPERANEIVNLIHAGAKEDGFSENIKGGAWSVVANLTDENERAYGAWAIGHGLGLNDDSSDFEGQGDNTNPLAALFAGWGIDMNALGDEDLREDGEPAEGDAE